MHPAPLLLMKSTLLACLLLFPLPAHAIGEALNTEWTKGAVLEVQLKLAATLGKEGKPMITGDLVIRNPGKIPLTVQVPDNRQALSFFVSDELGNTVAPSGRGKSDPAFKTRVLAPDKSFTHHLDGLEFVTGSAVFDYDLNPGKSYRIIAVYRAAGPQGPGFTSQETKLSIPQTQP
jgi:hypothetical protein